MPRIHPADEQASADLVVTAKQAPRLRLWDRLFLTVAALFLLGFGIAIYLFPQETFSEQENRALQTVPELSLSVLTDSTFSGKIADFYADQFPGRSAFVGLKTLSELALLKMENNDVLVGKDGYLIKRLEYGEAEYDNIAANMQASARFASLMEEAGIPTTLAIAPRALDVLGNYLPDYYDTARASAVWQVAEAARGTLTLPDLTAAMQNAEGEIWFRTDHHWTPLGAYYAYVALGEQMGYTPLPASALTAETIEAPFYGTTYSSAGISRAIPDTLTFYHIPGEEGYLCEIVDTGRSFTGFYDRSYLTGKDKYGALLSGNNGHVRITDTQNPNKPTLLLVKDSFAHAIVPYLAQHYNLEILDLRYWRGSTADLAEETDADQVLILMGLDSLATANTLKLLDFGLK